MSLDQTQDDYEYDLRAAQERAKAAKAKTKADKKAKAKLYAKLSAEEFVDNSQLYFLAKHNCYVEQINNEWHFFVKEALHTMYASVFGGPNGVDFREGFEVAMEEGGHNFFDCTYSFREQDGKLNMMDRSQWLKPVAGSHHWIFDVLMQSLGCGKPENIRHIEHVIAHKYVHPEDWRIPCLLIYGEGGVGKNLFVDTVLYNMYAEQTVSATSDNLIGTFNTLVKGKVVVLINETVVGKHDNAKLTNQLHKERFEMNEKCVKQYTVDNTPLYFLGSNDMNGGALLDRSAADRRLSVLRCERGMTLNYWIAKHENITPEEADIWMENHGGAILADPEQISHWLFNLLQNNDAETKPVALHGADYDKLMNTQEGMEERIAKAVFLAQQPTGIKDQDGNEICEDSFKYISVDDLFKGYELCCKSHGIRNMMKDKTFNIRIENWLSQNAPHIVKDTSKYNVSIKDVKDFKEGATTYRRQITKTVWLNTNLDLTVKERHANNHYDYFADRNNVDFWSIEV